MLYDKQVYKSMGSFMEITYAFFAKYSPQSNFFYCLGPLTLCLSQKLFFFITMTNVTLYNNISNFINVIRCSL